MRAPGKHHDPHLGGNAADERFHALAHFACGFVGEGQRENLAGQYALFANQIGDAVREHARLAAAGAGQHL